QQDRAARHPRPGADPDPRTRGPGRGKRAPVRQVHEPEFGRDFRRRRHQSADQAAQARRRHPGRHPGPPAGPRGPGHGRPVEDRNPDSGRSRPHAGHGLHPRHSQ
ncbi:hypothetical protein LTR94_035104, partial [Friedmanniomyces endolithicus]